MKPLLSVIIPTHKRPEKLENAILSALATSRTESAVEVIAIPNGPDDSWTRVQANFRHDERVRWSHLPNGHACAARNHGLSIAKGKYVRFLDDDDLLYPAAAEQLAILDRSGAEISSAPLEMVSQDGKSRHLIQTPETADFAASSLRSINVPLTQGSIFLRSAIESCRWRENSTLYDDYLWMLDIARGGERHWIKFEQPVSAYVNHFGERLSHTRRSSINSQQICESILDMHRYLVETSRITPERTHAVATALLTHAHSAFTANPAYLSRMIRLARSIDSSATPAHPIFRQHPWLAPHLLFFEWGFLLPRYLSRGYRRITWRTNRVLERVKITQPPKDPVEKE